MKHRGSCHCGAIAFEVEGTVELCPTGGLHPYAEGTDRHGTDTAAINLRCREAIDLSSIPVTHVDGRSM